MSARPDTETPDSQRSRSPTPTRSRGGRSRGRSYDSYDSYTEYSDSFASDEESVPVNKKGKKNNTQTNACKYSSEMYCKLCLLLSKVQGKQC